MCEVLVAGPPGLGRTRGSEGPEILKTRIAPGVRLYAWWRLALGNIATLRGQRLRGSKPVYTMWGTVLSKVVRVKYEKGVLKPLYKIEELKEGDIVLVKILGKDIAEEVFGSIKVDKEKVKELLREAEDELGMY